MRRIQEPSYWWILALMFLISPKHKDCHPACSLRLRRDTESGLLAAGVTASVEWTQ
ncbi:unnamed protein product [Tetraodon nigroviridis]|uniref:(spotted green pufferfish) hypothetical protein n=1 Tax=Tetraodon nigroviridis TaxID=99883 RepID=Q4RXD4_TETNG|nr:unnamed protein product [Tetraodon nigroviridis]